jgi:anti-sigma B factor antagonist
VKIVEKEMGDVAILELKGDVLGGPDALTFEDKLKEVMARGKMNILLDLGKVGVMNSSGLGIIIGGYTSCRNRGGNLKIVNPTKKISSLLIITKLITVIDSFEDLDSAIASFTKGE